MIRMLATPVVAQASGDGAAAWVVLSVLFWILLGLYLIPTIVAGLRKAPNLGSIVVINVFLGWTMLGWVGALAMAVRSTTPVQVVHVVPPAPDAPVAPPAAAPPVPPVPPGPPGGGVPVERRDAHGAG